MTQRAPTEHQVKLLTTLHCAARGMTIGELARAVSENYTATERRLHTLEKRGWLRRRAAPRGSRSKHIFLLAFDSEFMQRLVSRCTGAG